MMLLKSRISPIDLCTDLFSFQVAIGTLELVFTYEPRHEKTGLLPLRKQRRRSASQ